MSIKAMTWAFGLPLEARAKIALLAIADNARDDGTAFPSLDTIAEKSSQSVATVRRRIKSMEEQRVLRKEPRYRPDGTQTTDLIILNLDLKAEEIAARDTDTDDHAITETPENIGYQADTLPSQGCDPTVSDVTGGGSHCGNPNEPSSEPKDSTPYPLPGGRVVVAEVSEEPKYFAEFRRDYPIASSWNWLKVLPVFAALSPTDAEHAAAAAGPYAKQTLMPRAPKPMRPDRWLRERMFGNFRDAKLAPSQPAPPEPVWHVEGGNELRALNVACVIAGITPPEPRYRDGFEGRGVMRLPFDADLLAMAQFALSDVEEFPFDHAEGAAECAAWLTRLSKWTGVALRPRKIWLEPYDAAVHGVPFSHPDHKFRKQMMGLRVPWRWPPRKDGTLTPETDTEGAGE